MPATPYDAIADWYDAYLRQNPLYEEVILPGMLALAGDVAGGGWPGGLRSGLRAGLHRSRAGPARRTGDGR